MLTSIPMSSGTQARRGYTVTCQSLAPLDPGTFCARAVPARLATHTAARKTTRATRIGPSVLLKSISVVETSFCTRYQLPRPVGVQTAGSRACDGVARRGRPGWTGAWLRGVERASTRARRIARELWLTGESLHLRCQALAFWRSGSFSRQTVELFDSARVACRVQCV